MINPGWKRVFHFGVMPLCGVTSIRRINLLQNGISHQHVLSYNPKKAGLEEGLQEGKEVEIIKLGRKFGKSDAEILALLQEELQITEEQAKQVLEKYGKTLDL